MSDDQVNCSDCVNGSFGRLESARKDATIARLRKAFGGVRDNLCEVERLLLGGKRVDRVSALDNIRAAQTALEETNTTR